VKERAAAEALTVHGYRFEGDRLCKAERFNTLRGALGRAFIGGKIPDEAANPNGLRAKGEPPHSVFTADLIDEAGQPTREAVNEIIAFFWACVGHVVNQTLGEHSTAESALAKKCLS